MPPERRESGRLFRRTGIVVLLLVAFSAFVPSLMAVLHQSGLQRAVTVQRARASAEVVALAASHLMSMDDVDGVSALIARLTHESSDYVSAKIVGPDGEVLYHSDPVREGTLDSSLPTPVEATSLLGFDESLATTFLVATPILLSGIPWATLCIEVPFERLEAGAGSAALRILGTGILLLGIGAMCAYRLARSIASPIDRLVAVVKAVAGGDLDVSTGIRPNNEIGTLAHAIDEMALRLKDATGQLREYSRSLEAARDEALAASLAKSLFLANMSHEIRTPLNAVIGMTELTLQSPLDPEQHENLSTVMEAGEFLLAVIDDILDFSKIESGKMELSPHVFDCRTLVRSVVSLFSARAEKLGIDLVLDMHEDTPAFIETDANRLRQVLVNLVGNAIKFTKNGSIRIAVRPEGPLQTKDIARLQFEIRDTGIGIPEGKQASIFNAFEQADNSHTRDYGGTGLGLAISRQLVALLGGSLSVTSAVGQGSTFRFAIVAPASSERSDDAPVAGKTTSAVDRATLTPARCAKVLLAEDNAVNRKLVERILSQAGHRVMAAENGRIALEKLAAQEFDLVLMDIQMPEMDGLEATRRIRESELGTGRRIPIVALTAHAMGGDRERFLSQGMDEYLSKPLRARDLHRVIQELFPPRSRGEDLCPSA